MSLFLEELLAWYFIGLFLMIVFEISVGAEITIGDFIFATAGPINILLIISVHIIRYNMKIRMRKHLEE